VYAASGIFNSFSGILFHCLSRILTLSIINLFPFSSTSLIHSQSGIRAEFTPSSIVINPVQYNSNILSIRFTVISEYLFAFSMNVSGTLSFVNFFTEDIA
jgi:hypothetical protein